ncbi:MAG: hypothetical protein ACUVQ8_04925 [Nitrososphaeria archaeon]
MRGFIFVALTLAFFGLGTILVAPITQFVYEEYSNPRTFYIDSGYSQYNQTHIQLAFTIGYNGTIPLNNLDVKISFGERTAEAQTSTFTKGQKVISKMLLPAAEAQSRLAFKAKVKFILAGIYPIEILVTQN